MKCLSGLACAVAALLLQGCSNTALLRGAYESLQNFRQMACYKALGAGCEQRQSWDDYQRQRRSLDDESAAVDSPVRDLPSLASQ